MVSASFCATTATHLLSQIMTRLSISCKTPLSTMKPLMTIHSSALAAEHISMCSGCLVMTEWKDAYTVGDTWIKVRRMTDADIEPSVTHLRAYLRYMAQRDHLPQYARKWMTQYKQLAEVLERDGVPTNTGNDVPACSEDGIIYTCCGGVVFFNDVELVNRINMGEEVWPPVKY